MTVDETNELTTNIFENATVTPTLVTGAIVEAEPEQLGQAAQALLTGAVTQGALTASLTIDPTQTNSYAQWTTGEGEPVGMKIVLGQDVQTLMQQWVSSTIYVESCANGGVPQQNELNILTPPDGGATAYMLQYGFNYLAAIAKCCNPCPDVDCRQYYFLDNGISPPHYPVPAYRVLLPAYVNPTTQREIEWSTTNIQFPVDTTLAAPSVSKLGRFWWTYLDEFLEECQEPVQYIGLPRQNLQPPKHAPNGFGYVLAPGVTGVISMIPCGNWVNLAGGP